jgi:hypothetical protein
LANFGRAHLLLKFSAQLVESGFQEVDARQSFTSAASESGSDNVAQIFISYSRKDKEFVRKLSEGLVELRRDPWVDWKDIPLTAEWEREIFTNIEAAESFVSVVSPESVISVNCRKEAEHAVANNKRIVPILYRPVPDDRIPETLRKFQRIDFDGDDDFPSKLATLVAALDVDLAVVQ